MARDKNPLPEPFDWRTVGPLLPRPYRQGHLDSLCGIYAIVNGCRNAMFTLDPTRRVSWAGLFRAMVDDLTATGELGGVLCHGMEAWQHSRMVAVARRHLGQVHQLRLTTRKAWWGHRGLTKASAFAVVRRHLSCPGASALLSFDTATFSHWTVISSIDRRHIRFTDSIGMKVRSLSQFVLAGGRSDPFQPQRSHSVDRSSLILLSISQRRSGSTPQPQLPIQAAGSVWGR